MNVIIDIRGRTIKVRETVTALELYRYLQSRFDDVDLMPFPNPMSRSGGQQISNDTYATAIYQVHDTWIFDRESFGHITEGSVIMGDEIYSSFIQLDEESEHTVYHNFIGLRLIRV